MTSKYIRCDGDIVSVMCKVKHGDSQQSGFIVAERPPEPLSQFPVLTPQVIGARKLPFVPSSSVPALSLRSGALNIILVRDMDSGLDRKSVV